MLQFQASDFVNLIQLLTIIESLLGVDQLRELDSPISNNADLTGRLPELRGRVLNACRPLCLTLSIAQVGRIGAAIKRDCTFRELQVEVKTLNERIEDELVGQLLLHVPPNKASYYMDKELFGSAVETKLQEASYDIAEAGKCLALARPTAAVFHLMRVLEIGVARFATKLSTTINTDRAWGEILRDVRIEIDTLKRSGADVSDLEQIQASLHAVKDAWRNPTMHPTNKYTEDEAEEIFHASRTFMRRVAQTV